MPLEAKDLWSLNQRDSSKVMVPNLLKEWEKEQIKAKRFALKDKWEECMNRACVVDLCNMQ